MTRPLEDQAELIARLQQHVDRLAGLIGPRHAGRPQSLAAAATLIERELASAGYAVERQAYLVRGQEVANVIAELPWVQQPEQVVILGAHYDTVETTPGADDNASTVAVLLESARLLAGQPLARTVRFVAFACEEPPHHFTGEMGSQVHARQCRVRQEQVVGMLCLEMVGYYSSLPNSQKLPPSLPSFLRFAFPRRGDFLAAVGNLRSWRLLRQFRRGFKRAVRFPLYSIALPEAVHEIWLSDQSSFWDQGYPALMLTDTSFLRNPHYHLASDLPDTLNYACMAEVTRGVLGGVAQLAGAVRPKF